MKKTILAVIMVLVFVTPCLAQEIEPEGMFSIEGTLWLQYEIIFFPFPPFVFVGSEDIGFYKGKVYGYEGYGDYYFPIEESSYIDLLMVSIAYSIRGILSEAGSISLAIMQPIGIGVMTSINIMNFYPPKIPFFTIGILIKVDDNWIPPEVE